MLHVIRNEATELMQRVYRTVSFEKVYKKFNKNNPYHTEQKVFASYFET